MEILSKWYNSLTPREQKRAIVRVGVGVGVGWVGILGVVVILAADYRDAPRVPEYPRVQVENDSFRLARLSPILARVTLFDERVTEKQRDVLWRDIFASLQQDGPLSCYWTLKGKTHDNPPSFIAGCN